MAADFLAELYRQGLVDEEDLRWQTPAEQMRARVRAYADVRGWTFHTGSSPGQLSYYRDILGPTQSGRPRPESRLVGARRVGGRVHVVAPTDIIKKNMASILFEGTEARLSPSATRLENMASVLQVHE